MDLFLQFVANGLVNGIFYAMTALGLTLIFGRMRVVNFAHGEMYMLGGVAGWFLTTYLGLNFWFGLILAGAGVGLVGLLIERFLIERLRGQGEEPGILFTIGLSIFLANLVLLTVGPAPLKVAGAIHEGAILVGPVIITKLRLIAAATGVVLVIATHFLIQRTRIGQAMRATFQDPMAASLVGIRIGHIHALTFSLGCALAALSGMLLGSIYSAQATIGGMISLKSFVIVILGGMGSFAGAILGGLFLGVAEALWGGYVSVGTVDIVGFVLVILILLFRPQGLFAVSAERA